MYKRWTEHKWVKGGLRVFEREITAITKLRSITLVRCDDL